MNIVRLRPSIGLNTTQKLTLRPKIKSVLFVKITVCTCLKWLNGDNSAADSSILLKFVMQVRDKSPELAS